MTHALRPEEFQSPSKYCQRFPDACPPMWSIFSYSTSPDFPWILPALPSQALHTSHSLWGTWLPNQDLPVIPEAELSEENQVRMLNQWYQRLEDPCKGLIQVRRTHLVFSTESSWIFWSHCVERPLLKASLGPSKTPSSLRFQAQNCYF